MMVVYVGGCGGMRVWKMWWKVGEGEVRLTKFSFVRVSRMSGFLWSSRRHRTSDLFRSSGAWAKIGLGKKNSEISGEEEDGEVEIK